MARPIVSLDETVQSLVKEVVTRATRPLVTVIAQLTAEELERQLTVATNGARRNGHAKTRARARRTDLTKWVADKRARRVPNFVIEMTGLDTKKKIVAKFGEDVAFEKGKPGPKPLAKAS